MKKSVLFIFALIALLLYFVEKIADGFSEIHSMFVGKSFDDFDDFNNFGV